MIEDILFSILMVLSGSFFTFLSAVVLYAPQESLQKLESINKQNSYIIEKLSYLLEERINPFLFLEFIIYLAVSFYLGSKLIMIYEWYVSLEVFIILFLTIITCRALFFSVGGRFAGSLISPMSGILRFVYYFTTPILLLNRSITSRLIKRNLSDATREELDAMLENSHEEGSLDSDEYRILKNMMKFGSVLVSDVMTPRTVICSLDADSTISEVIDLQEIKMYSRLPVWSGKSLDDETIGYVLSKDILLEAIKDNHDMKVSELSRQVYFIPENAPLDNALDSFLQRRQHLFIVVDEYGGVEGLLTMEDVLETILGVEIVDEADKVIDLRLYAKQLRDKRVASLQGKVDLE